MTTEKILKEWQERPLKGWAYGLIGLAAFAFKFNLDHALAMRLFHRSWQLWDYWRGLNAFYLMDLRRSVDTRFFISLLALALPFIAFGVSLTARRLRTLGWNVGWAALFFVPYVNLFFFTALTLAPEKTQPPPAPPSGSHAAKALDVLIPTSSLGCGLAAVFYPAFIVLALAGLDIRFFRLYGFALFVMLPFVHGLLAAWLYNYRAPRTFTESQMVGLLSCALAGVLLLLCAFEGLICIAMAAPIWIGLAAFGSWIGWLMGRQRIGHSFSALLLVIAAAPLLMGAEYALKRPAPLLEVRSAIRIQAPPERVWRHVVSFSELPSPREWIFRAGIAYPIRAKISGRGPGAIRRCEFSTGAFIEPIEIWKAPTLLRFGVTENPPPMRELSLYSRLDPPHLHGFLVSKRGQFLLTRLANGDTQLEGTTWYQHHLWPAAYWRWWSDFIIHRIHLRVLRQIKALAEGLN